MRVLVVDDERSNLEELAAIFAMMDVPIEADFLANPYEALVALEKEDFCAALLDIEMPGLSGIELAERIRQRCPRTRTVFLTAYNHYATEAFEVEAVDYILKPIRAERVERTLRRIASSHAEKCLEPAPKRFVIQGFGDYQVWCGDRVLRWDRRKTAELFWFLATHRGKRVHKEAICAVIWENFPLERALPNLQVTMSRLRRDLRCFTYEQVSAAYAEDSYCLSIGTVVYDVAAFCRLLGIGGRAALTEAVALYQGDYLHGCEWLWVEPEREVLRQLYQKATLELAGILIGDNAYGAADQLLTAYMRYGYPQEQVAALILEVAARRSGRSGVVQALTGVRRWYRESLDMDIPSPIKRLFTRLSSQPKG